MTEEVFETTEGETVDLYDKLMEMTRWIVTDEENKNDLTGCCSDNKKLNVVLVLLVVVTNHKTLRYMCQQDV